MVSGNENTNAGSRLTVGTHACFRRVTPDHPCRQAWARPHRTRGAEQHPLLRAPNNEGADPLPHPLAQHQMGCLKPSPAHHTPTQKLWCFPAAWDREGVPPQGLDLLYACVTHRPLDSATQSSIHPSALPTQSRLCTHSPSVFLGVSQALAVKSPT